MTQDREFMPRPFGLRSPASLPRWGEANKGPSRPSEHPACRPSTNVLRSYCAKRLTSRSFCHHGEVRVLKTRRRGIPDVVVVGVQLVQSRRACACLDLPDFIVRRTGRRDLGKSIVRYLVHHDRPHCMSARLCVLRQKLRRRRPLLVTAVFSPKAIRSVKDSSCSNQIGISQSELRS